MADLKAGHWIMVSDGSIEKLKRFFRGCREQSIETAGLVVAPPHSRKLIAAAQLDWPAGWGLYTSGPLYTNRDQWFGILWDDQCPECPRWDARLVEQVVAWRVVTSQEGSHGDWCAAAVCWGIPALEVGGGLNLQDLYSSLRQWAANAEEAKIFLYDQMVPLSRAGYGRSLPNNYTAHHKTALKLREFMSQCGARVAEPDWSKVSLMIATPSMASRPEAMYMLSLFAQLQDLKNLGVSAHWGLERYNADIGLARSHIISEFLRGDASHLLMIDDDMTWDISALHRLVFADKDLVAVAGPKKRFPLVFAASLTDEAGEPLSLTLDQETGTAEVSHVGTAFMLISRSCAEKMRDAYPELEYDGGDGKVCWGLFLQAIQARRYMPEDFSFCERWRRIGGKVYICPDVPLGHIGSHEFRGDLWSNGMKAAQ